MCRNVVDGDLCEQFGTLVEPERATVQKALEHTRQEILNRIEEVRHRVM